MKSEIQNEIDGYWHCDQCMNELPDDQTPAEFARLNIGPTVDGFQVWCVRHECNVVKVEATIHKAI